MITLGLLIAIIGLLIAVIILAINNGTLNKQVKELKKRLKEYENGEYKENVNTNQIATEQNRVSVNNNPIESNASINKQVAPSNYQSVKTETVKAKKSNDGSSKNILILISGSILIVLSAIVFLVTTWNTIPDAIKTITLTLLVGVFLGASHIAKKNFKLEQTAKTFYYIAMIYIPIALVSIALFKLFGEYLSLSGAGKYIYLSICSILLAILYFMESIRNKGNALIVLSVISQILAVIFIALMLKAETNGILLALVIYSLISNLVFNKKTLQKLNLEKYELLYIISSFIIFGTVVLEILKEVLISGSTIIDVLSMAIITLNLYLTRVNNVKLKVCYDIGILLTILSIISLKGLISSINPKALIFTTSMLILYSIDYVRTQKKEYKIVYKIISYISLNLVLLFMLLVLNLKDYIRYIPLITTMLTMIAEKMKRDEGINYYIFASFILTFLVLNIDLTIASFIALLVGIALYCLYIKTEKMDETFLILPALAIIPSIFTSKVIAVETINIALTIILLLITTAKSVVNKNINVHTFISVIYILLTLTTKNFNTYINSLIVLIWGLAHLLMHENKNIYKAVIYGSLLFIYNQAIKDIGITDIALINTFGYITCTILVSRTILKDNKELSKVCEYIFLSAIYVYSLNTFKNSTDAMIYITFLFALTVVGYIKKAGPIFLTSIIAIVVYIIDLTKEFWQSIPWYVYMLVVGSALIIFAIRNEMNEKKTQKTIGNTLKRIKDNMNL